jgi:hypothetical protein
MTVQSDSLGGTIFWQELHSSVMTNAQGVINLVLGKGVRQTASTVATFADIDWNVTPKFLKIEIDYSGWKTMGVSKLWSVPYALIAGDLAGSVKKLAVEGETSGLEEALFEVKNKDGQTVFAVYNEGVRVYVSDGAKALKGGFAVGGFGTDKAESTKYLFVGKDSVRVYLDTNPLTKKLKGGFAVGGYDMTKGTIQDYLDVNSDSVRIYIDSNPATKKLKGGFAVGGYDMTKGTNINYMNVNTDASGIIYPSQNRILWYPLKNSFLTGKVLVEKPDSVGENSFASGYESKAKGQYSQALGYKAIARGDYSTAIGKNALANKINSFAFGENAQAKNAESYAFGRGAIADGERSFAFGSSGIDSARQITGVAYARGNYSFAIGQGSQSTGEGAFTLGLADTATGNYSVALGYKTHAKGYGSTSLGNYSKASGQFSTAMGKQTEASAESSTAMGNYAVASGIVSIAMGNHPQASGLNSNAIGFYTIAKGEYSTAIGLRAYAEGARSLALGCLTVARGWNSAAIGYNTVAKPCNSLAIGYYNDTTCTAGGDLIPAGADPLFIIGNGTPSVRGNAMTVLKNGYTAIGHASPTQMLDVNGNARFRFIGSGAYVGAVNRTSDGSLTYATSDIRSKENINTLNNSLHSVMNLRGISFTWENEPEMGKRIGFIAQEVEQVIPELVFTNPADGLKGVNYAEMTAVLVEAMKEQQHQIEFYKSQLQSLQEEVEQIKAMLVKGDGR